MTAQPPAVALAVRRFVVLPLLPVRPLVVLLPASASTQAHRRS
jgi:hypothetical protein